MVTSAKGLVPDGHRPMPLSQPRRFEQSWMNHSEVLMCCEEVSARSGASPELVRECEARGFLADHAIQPKHPRFFTAADVRTLRFVRRSLSFSFAMEEIAALIGLWRDPYRVSAAVKAIAIARASLLDQSDEENAVMKAMLERLVRCCGGNEKPSCAILDELSDLSGFACCHNLRGI